MMITFLLLADFTLTISSLQPEAATPPPLAPSSLHAQSVVTEVIAPSSFDKEIPPLAETPSSLKGGGL
jgi:hypothetical protein